MKPYTADRRRGNNGKADQPADPTPQPRTVLRIGYEGVNKTPAVPGIDQLPGVANYLIGNESAKWRKDIVTYAGIAYNQLYPGIDLHFDGAGGQLKSTYTIAPGADPSTIRWRYSGAVDPHVDEFGNLIIDLPRPSRAITPTDALTRTLTEQAPVAWQQIDQQRIGVQVRYVVAPNQRVSFAVGAYDRTRPLIIDPTFSTYLGGSGTDEGRAVGVDADRNVYVTGYTGSTLFPTMNPTQGDQPGDDVFVAKYTESGTLLFSTYFGGSGSDQAEDIAVNPAGSVFVTGSTYSPDLPTLSARQSTLQGTNDAFVFRLDLGNQLMYSTYLGGASSETGYALAIDTSTNTAYITGWTSSNDFPDHMNQRNSSQDAFVASLGATGAFLIYSRYLGGSSTDEGNAIAIDSNANAYVTGVTWSSTDFPRLNAYQNTFGGGSYDAFVTKLGTDGALMYSTYLGGSGNDSGEGIAVAQGAAYITGFTASSAAFPGVTTSSQQPSYGGGSYDAFVTKVNDTGTALAYSTYLGGAGADLATDIAVSPSGVAYLTGYTASSVSFPTVAPLQATNKGGNYDAFVSVIDPALPPAQAMRYSTFLGGSGTDQAYGIALDANVSIYVTGTTSSNDFPTFNQYQNYAGNDVFVAKLSDTIGFEDFDSAAAAGTEGDTTADKPQSKLWWNDGIWWAVMFSVTDNKYQIYKLNWPDKWVRTPAAIDDRPTSRADALWDDVGKKLYIVSVVSVSPPKDPNAQQPAGDQARLYRYSYNSITKAYTLDSGFPNPYFTGQTETMTIAKDSVGKLWVAYTNAYKVWYKVSSDDGVNWSSAQVIPNTPDVDVSYDDIASVVAFNGKIGVLWSDHNPLLSEQTPPVGDPNATFRFSYRDDTSPITTWQPTVSVTLPAGLCASDDHINLKSIQADASGRLYAAVKTSFVDKGCNHPLSDPQILLLMRKSDGTWTWSTFGTGQTELTRPVVLLDNTNNMLYMFATSPEAGGTIYMKSTNLDNPSFADQPGLGRPFISSGTNINLNNPTATKQTLNGTTDLVILATDEVTHKYMHNVIDLPGQAPPPVTNMLINGSFELDANADGRPDSWSSNSKFTRSSAIPAIDGSYVGRFFATDNSGTTISQQLTGLTAGTSYNVAGKVNIPATSDAFTFKLEVKWYNASGGTISTSNVKTYSAATSGWDTAGANLVAPSGATTADMRMNVSSLNATIYVDNLTFSTGTPADTTPPTVTSKTPAAGATGVQVGQNVSAVFSEAVSNVSTSSFTLTPQGGSALAATVTYDAANKTAALDPNVDLLPNTSYTAQLTSAIKDAANNALVLVSWSFTTAATADTTPPTVTSTTPASGATGVAVASNITAQFSEAVSGVSSTSFTLTPQAGGSALAASVTYDAAGKTATLNPTADLAANTAYTAQLSSAITDAANNGLAPVSWSFTTGAAGGGTTVSFGADADTYVSQASPTSAYGTSSSVSIVGGSGSAKQAFLRFTVSGLPAGATISSAKLRLYVTNDSTSGGVFNRITSTSWAESITWNTQPAIDGPQLASLSAVAINTFYDVDITTAISGNGTYSFAITLPTANTNTLGYASKEASTVANRPQLIVTSQ